MTDENDRDGLEPVHEPGAVAMPAPERKPKDDVEGALQAMVRASRTLAEAAEMIAVDAKRTVSMARQLAEAHAAVIEAPPPRPQPSLQGRVSLPAPERPRPQAAPAAPRREAPPAEAMLPAPGPMSVAARMSSVPAWAVAAVFGVVVVVGAGLFVWDRIGPPARSPDVFMATPPAPSGLPLRVPSQDTIPDRYLPQDRR